MPLIPSMGPIFSLVFGKVVCLRLLLLTEFLSGFGTSWIWILKGSKGFISWQRPV